METKKKPARSTPRTSTAGLVKAKRATSRSWRRSGTSLIHLLPRRPVKLVNVVISSISVHGVPAVAAAENRRSKTPSLALWQGYRGRDIDSTVVHTSTFSSSITVGLVRLSHSPLHNDKNAPASCETGAPLTLLGEAVHPIVTTLNVEHEDSPDLGDRKSAAHPVVEGSR